jgi:hypothetical protein
MPEQVRYRTKLTQSGIFLVRYRTKIQDAGMPMPALVSSMPMPSYAFLQCLDHLNFLCIFHKQAGSESGSEIKVKVGSGSGSEKNNFGSTTLQSIIEGDRVAEEDRRDILL